MKFIKYVFLTFSIFSALSLFAQEITLEGTYIGKNLYILNPDIENGFCVKEVKVNGLKTRDELNSNSFEIDFSQMNIETGKNVYIQIFHKPNCKPIIINPEVLVEKLDFSFQNAKVNRKGFLCWDINGNLGEGLFTVEQFRWKKWIKVGELKSVDTVSINSYALEISPNTAQNIFRVQFKNAQGRITTSKEIKYILPGKEIMILTEKIKDRIAFSSVTIYEIIDESGNLMLQGNDKYIDVSGLPKGSFFLNYDNKTEVFTKK